MFHTLKRPYVGLFEKSGNMALPWLEAGHPCLCLDIDNDNEWRDGAFFAQCDLSSPAAAMAIITAFCGGRGPGFVAAFTPCDHVAVSGARWFAGKGLGALRDSVNLFAVTVDICTAFDAPYMIENPVSTISTYWRKPDHTFHPNDYAGLCADDTYTKKTCLWTGNGFVMPDPVPLHGVEPDDRIHKAPPGPGRKDFRGATPIGFARAVFSANSPQPATAMTA